MGRWKFGLGDKVRVVKLVGYDKDKPQERIGQVGFVVGYDEYDEDYPYLIGKSRRSTKPWDQFRACELKLMTGAR